MQRTVLKPSNAMTEKKIHLIETYPDGLKTIRSYLSEINAKYSVFANPDDAMNIGARPDMVILLARKDAEQCNEDITRFKNDHSFSTIPLMLMMPPQTSAHVHAIRKDKCQFTFQLPVDKLPFLARVAQFLNIPPRRIFQAVITIMEESGNMRYSGLSVDFSETGMAFESDAEFVPGLKIIIRFVNPKNRAKFLLNAEIVRRSQIQGKAGFFYGVRFTGMTFKEGAALRNFISGEADENRSPAGVPPRIA
jgi:hypothetical protein